MACRSRNSNPKYENSAEKKAPLRNSQGTHRKPLRIVDVMREPEGCALDGSMERHDHAAVYCSSPRKIMTRWISGLKKRKQKTDSFEPTKGGDGSHREGNRDCHAGESGKITASESDSSVIVKSGSVRKSHSFTLGVGCCLLYLVAAGRSELSKIVEMKVQMAELLRNVKEDLQVKNASCSNSVEKLHCPEMCSSSRELHMTSRRNDFDELEAELECELARLDIHQEEDASSVAKLHGIDKERAYSKSGRNLGGIDCNGVCPYELERKLYDILKQRQEEHIRELEVELDCVKKKLVEKEMEIALWKDTAKMILNGKSESIKLLDSPTTFTPCVSFNLR